MRAKNYKILYLINGLGPGGAENMLYRLLQGLDRSTFQPEVIALLDIGGPLKEKIEELDIPVQIIGIRSKKDIASLSRLYRALKKSSPDILHTQLFGADILGRLMGRALKIPVIITSIRNTLYPGPGRDFLLKVTERFAQQTTIVSQASAESFIARGVVPRQKLKVIYSGIDPAKFYSGLDREAKEEIRAELHLPREGFILLAVGSLTAQKGYFDLLEAVSLLAGSDDKVPLTLIIVGSGEMESEIRDRVDALNISEAVLFLGRRDDVPRLMAAADALVLSSHWEGLPGVVLEAMASELPVVATSVGGVPEIGIDGATGFTVPPRQPQALAAALDKIVNTPSIERLQMGRAGRSRVIEKFHVQKMIAAYEELYLKAIKQTTNVHFYCD